MACTITITGATGSYTAATLTGVTVKGTSLGCEKVNVTIQCGDPTHPPQSLQTQVSVVSGAWIANFPGPGVHLPNCVGCGQPLAISASCATGSGTGCNVAAGTFTLICPDGPCCPAISTQVSYGPCDAAGNSVVTFIVKVTPIPPNGCPETNIQMDFGDGSLLGAIHPFSASGTFSETHQYSSGPHDAFVNVISPRGCQQAKIPIDVQCPPPCCPSISTQVSYGRCDAAGNSLVTFRVKVIPVPHTPTNGCPETNVQMDFGDGSPLGAIHPFSAAGTFSETHQYSPGPHDAFVNVISPPGCQQVKIPLDVQCPACCPDVIVTPCIPDCDSSANRTVAFQITVTKKPLPCPQSAVSFQMDFGDGSNGVPVTVPTGVPSYTYAESHTYSGNAALQDNTASVQVSQPPQCAGTYSPHVIPACCTRDRAAWCITLFCAMSFSLTFALLFLLLWVIPRIPPLLCTTCSPFNLPGPALLNIFYALAIAGMVSLIIYLIFCRKCSCDWFYRLLGRMLFGAGLLYAIFADCGLNVLSVVIGLILMGLGYLCFKKWQRDCCVTPCNFLWEIAFWMGLLVSIAGFLIAKGLGSGCVYTIFHIVFGSFNITITSYDVALALSVAFFKRYHDQCGRK